MDYETAGKLRDLWEEMTTTAIECGPIRYCTAAEGRPHRHEYYCPALRLCLNGNDADSYIVEFHVPSPRSLLLFEDGAVLAGDWVPPREVMALAGVA